MKWKGTLLFVLTLLISISCDNSNEDPIPIEEADTPPSDTSLLLEALEQELEPLTANPLSWTDDNLGFLDLVADRPIIALGEATHGTAEFFDSKFRIFKYLVENHNFKILAIEADFGESLLINDAIQRGATDEIDGLMRNTMQFWTWRTEEVKRLLEWMSEYNIGKPEEDKIHYVGFDCQFNTYHPDMVEEYLQTTGASFLTTATEILNEAEAASQANFESYNSDAFTAYLDRLDALQDSFTSNAAELIAASSEKEFRLNERLVRVIRQVSEVRYANKTGDFTLNYRDLYMAENTSWFYEFFNGKKMALWAHNAHIANDPTLLGGGGAMGRHLRQEFGRDYTTIAFLFAQGSFTARTQNGNQFGALEQQNIGVVPKRNSLNYYMSISNEAVFSIEMDQLQSYSIWAEAFVDGVEYFEIGALFNNDPDSYYRTYNPIFFDYIIYFDRTNPSVLLN